MMKVVLNVRRRVLDCNVKLMQGMLQEIMLFTKLPVKLSLLFDTLVEVKCLIIEFTSLQYTNYVQSRHFFARGQ